MKTNQTPSTGSSILERAKLHLLLLLSLAAGNALATVRYVDANSLAPAPPYTNWARAAQVIQDAVDVALAGDEIVVTNGIYASGGRAVGTNVLVNRVAVDKPLTLRSVNGPQVTVIQGYQVPVTTNGDGAVRCVYLANGASLSGFTLTQGATRTVDDAPVWAQSGGGGVRCESDAAVVSNCTLIGNSAYDTGGGAYQGTLNHCTLSSNSAFNGGGACGGTLNNCALAGNSGDYGGGACCGTLNNCALSGNSAASGGGAAGCSLNNCTFTGNSAKEGGGTYNGRLNNCVVYFNTAPDAPNYGGDGPYDIVLNYCCTTPKPTNGVGNLSLDPQLASASHLSAGSPCRGAGSPAYTIGTDIDGEAWDAPPSIGCDEYHAGAVTGPLSVGVIASFTNVAVGYPVELTALIEGRVGASAWQFGDGTAASNRPYATHAWTAPGDYTVVLRASNDDQPDEVSAVITVHVAAQPVHYVAADSTSSVPPYTSWATAACNIQEAVDAVSTAGALVLVSNGVFATGGRAVVGTMTNRVAVDKPLTLLSVNGPEVTIIQGYQVPGTTNGDGAIRCVYLANGANLSGFTLTKGATRVYGYPTPHESSGGALWCESPTEVVSNCTLTGNSALNGGGTFGGTLNNCRLTGNFATESGGGAYSGMLNNCTLNNCALIGNSADGSGGGALSGILNNCTLTGNSARDGGGGACGATLNNCTLVGNSASWGGGAHGGTLNNCIVFFNVATNGANYYQYVYYQYDYTTLHYCCTTPMPTNGVGNITNAPLFVDYAGGNLRLQTNSPCINAGLNAYAPGPTDLDGNPRVVSGTVDIGANEYQGPGSTISYAWLQQFSLPTDGSADFLDLDSDGLNNWQEWRCRTDPTSALSALRLWSACPDGADVTVTWQSVAGVTYFLERSTNLASSPCFLLLVSDIVGQPGTTRFTDTNAASLAPLFYRVRVGN